MASLRDQNDKDPTEPNWSTGYHPRLFHRFVALQLPLSRMVSGSHVKCVCLERVATGPGKLPVLPKPEIRAAMIQNPIPVIETGWLGHGLAIMGPICSGDILKVLVYVYCKKNRTVIHSTCSTYHEESCGMETGHPSMACDAPGNSW